MKQTPRIAIVKEIYENLYARTDAMLELAKTLYHPDIVFRDPIQTTRGLDDFLAANRRLVDAMRSIRFTLHDAFEDEDRAFATWTFNMHPKRGLRFAVHGASHMRFRDEKIVWHRDYWDLWGSFADSIPGVAGVYRNIIRRFA